MSLTDEIYRELMDGLGKGLDWQQFLDRYGKSKGPFYNAASKALRDIGRQITASHEEKKKTQERANQAGLKLDQLNRKTKELDSTIEDKASHIAAMEKKESALKRQIGSLDSELVERSQSAKQLAELEKLGFHIEKLQKLHALISRIGTQRGLKPKESVDAFFVDLEDYDAKKGFQQDIERLDVIIRTKSLDADKWRAEAETLERQYRELKEAINAIQSLGKYGVNSQRIVSWNNSLISIGGVEELEKGLVRYKSAQVLMAAKKREQKQLDMKLRKLDGAVNTLKEQKAELEGSISTLRISAIKEIERLSQAGTRKIAMMAQAGTSSLKEVRETALTELREALSQVDEISARALQVGKLMGQLEDKLDKSKKTREEAEALVARIEAGE